MAAKSEIKIAEIFYSLQGEGMYAGVPSVFLRTFGCNFECRGFGMPAGQRTNEPERIAEVISLYKQYDELPLTTYGCDSYASWHPAFKKYSPKMSIQDIADRMHSLLPNGVWNKDTRFEQDIHLVITGGEPLLGWQREYPALLDICRTRGLANLTFETNGTQALTEDFSTYLFEEITRYGRSHNALTFSVSPKLPCSGEPWEKAIRPEVVKSYELVGNAYLKFVVANEEDLHNVDRAVEEYRAAGFGGPVYLMPAGGMPEVYHANTQQVAEYALRKGYRYSPRLQVDIWKNAWAT